MIDRPGPGTSLTDFLISGWAVDTGAPSGTGIDAVHVYAFPNPGSGAAPIFLGVAAYGAERPDVASYKGGAQFTKSGYSLSVAGLQPGNYLLAVFGHSTVTNSFSVSRTVSLDTFDLASRPGPATSMLIVDTPATGSALSSLLTVSGWALDLRSTKGPGVELVQVWAYPSPGSGTTPIFSATRRTVPSARMSARRSDRASTPPVQSSASRVCRLASTTSHLGLSNISLYVRSCAGRAGDGQPVGRRVRRHSGREREGAAGLHHFRMGARFCAPHQLFRRGSMRVHVWAYPVAAGGSPILPRRRQERHRTRRRRGRVQVRVVQLQRLQPLDLDAAAGHYDIVAFGHSSLSNAFENARMVRVTVE